MKAFIEFLGENLYIISFYRGKHRVAYIIFAIIKILYGGAMGVLSYFGIRFFTATQEWLVFLPWGIFSIIRGIAWEGHTKFLHLLQLTLTLLVTMAFWTTAIIVFRSTSNLWFFPQAITATIWLSFLILYLWYERSHKQNPS
jgi:hypothetical protein